MLRHAPLQLLAEGDSFSLAANGYASLLQCAVSNCSIICLATLQTGNINFGQYSIEIMLARKFRIAQRYITENGRWMP